MGQKSMVGTASLLLVGAALAGCQSNDSWRGQSSGLSNAGINRPLPTNPNASPAASSWGMNSAMNNQPGMSRGTTGLQQASGTQPSANATGIPGLSNSAATANPLAISRPTTNPDNPPTSSLTSRQTDLTVPALPSPGRTVLEKGTAVGPDPLPPSPPPGSAPSSSDQSSGTYTIPAPKAYSPPANSEVKTRVPGDDN